MKILIFALYLTLQSFSIQATSAEIAYTKTNPFGDGTVDFETVLIKGEITPGDYIYLLELIKKNPKRFNESKGITLSSPGGDIQEAIRIARFVKGSFTPVFVGNSTGPCASACFFIFVASPRREADDKVLGIHRPYIHPKRLVTLTPRQAENIQRSAQKEARLYLEEHDVPTSLIDKMFKLASTEVYWLSADQAAAQLGRRPPWYEQFLIAHCGLNKSIEDRFFKTNDHNLLKHLMKVENCGWSLTRIDAKIFLENEIKSLKNK